MTRDHLYPHIEPRRSGAISLDDTHEMYWEESGNPDGIPLVFLHGGPGAGTGGGQLAAKHPAKHPRTWEYAEIL